MTTALVLGGGIVGSCIALELQRAGHATTLVERGEPGMGASFGNAGHIGTASVLPQAVPGIWRNVPKWLRDPGSPLAVSAPELLRHLPWFLRFILNSPRLRMERNAEGIATLLREAPEAWSALSTECGTDELFDRDSGLLHVFERHAALEGVRWTYELRERLGVPVREMNSDATRAREPTLAPHVAAGMLLPAVWAVRDPLALTRAVLARFAALGGTVRRAEATALHLERGRMRAVESTNGTLDADLFVIAAGAWSGPYGRQLGARVPLAAERGYHVMARRGNAPVRQPLMLTERRIVVSPMLDGLRLTTLAEFALPDAAPDHDRAAAAFARAEGAIPGVTGGIATRWMGPRPSTPDGLPLVGRAPRAENVILAYGHGHLGLTLAALTGRLVAGAAAGQALPSILAPERAA